MQIEKIPYGLKQSPRAWFGRFTKSMLDRGYSQSQGGHALFIKLSSIRIVTILSVYVDDIIVIGDDNKEMLGLNVYLAKGFEIKDLGSLSCFLRIEVVRSQHGIFISEQKYTQDLFQGTGMAGCKPIDTPMEAHHLLGEKQKKEELTGSRYLSENGQEAYLPITHKTRLSQYACSS